MKMTNIDYIKLFTDGGSRNNPGEAGYGFVVIGVTQSGAEIILKKCGDYINIATNNVAEYLGIINGLKWLIKTGWNHKKTRIFMDSQLIVNQIKGKYRVKNQNLKKMWLEVMDLLSKFKDYNIEHVYRSQNTLADKIANKAMDLKTKVEE